MLMGYEALNDLPTENVEVKTPIETCKTPMLSGRKLAVVPILRAGLGMVGGITALVPTAKIGHIGLCRNEETHQPEEYYCKLPDIIEERQIVVVDPMLATGGSAIAAINFIKQHGGKNIKFLCIIAAPEGVSAVISYARDFMIDRGFTYCVPPFMIRSNVVTGVMSFAEMDAMMYKIEGEDLYLIGTSEHSMIGKFIDTQLTEDQLPQTLTSYSPCFRKEKGAHGIEERGVYRIHQFEKQEMIVVCKPEDSKEWYDKLWQNTVDLFRSMDIPVRTLECCSGDLADLKVKSVDVEAWSPRQKKYFEVGSCSNLGDAQARRLGIRVKGNDGSKYFAHTLNNTVVAPPRMLIAFLENNLQADGSVKIPEALQPYMGGNTVIVPKHK